MLNLIFSLLNRLNIEVDTVNAVTLTFSGSGGLQAAGF